MRNLRPRWTGSYHSKEGFQVSKGNRKGTKGNQQGDVKKQDDCAMYIVNLYMCIKQCLNVEVNNNLNCV